MAEDALRSNSDSSLDFGDMWRYGCPKSPVWAGSGGTPSLKSYEHNVGNLAVEVVTQNWSSEVISFFLRGLGGRAGGFELPLCQWTSCVRK